jgi:PIN domain nuclease of toxin-antitoxin system
MAGGSAVILLDTHVLVWMASSPDQLSQAAREALHQFKGSLLISAVSAWEIALLHKRGRLLLPVAPEVFVQRAVTRHGLNELPVTTGVAMAAVALPDIHNDPFDRILIAETLERKCRIVTKDGVIPTYPGVPVVW